jgi:hypothetical protein
MAGKNPRVPWYEELSDQQMNEWWSQDEEGCKEYLRERTSTWEEEESKLLPNEPNKLAFEYQENDLQYQSRLTAFHVGREIEASQERTQEKAKQSYNQQSLGSPLSAIDEHEAERIKWSLWEAEYLQKAEDAKRRGDLTEEKAHRERARWGPEELKKLPKPWGQQKAEEAYMDNLNFGLGRLFNEAEKGQSYWDDERLQHDSLLSIHQWNRNTKGPTLVMCKEKSPKTREYLEPKPGNIIKFDLDENLKKSFLYNVYECGQDPAEFLRKIGQGHLLEEEISPEPVEETVVESEEKVHPYEKMTQKEFERTRDDEGASKY